ncbi:MAG TPA: hypothetical protein VIM06_01385, partial [Rhodanobacter sp.]
MAKHPMFVRFAFGGLALGGVMHFAIDVLSQYFRGTREPGPETSLYYGGLRWPGLISGTRSGSSQSPETPVFS